MYRPVDKLHRKVWRGFPCQATAVDPDMGSYIVDIPCMDDFLIYRETTEAISF